MLLIEPGLVLGGSLLLHAILPMQTAELEALDRAARAFAGRPQVQRLVENNQPLLARAYPRVVRDYFSTAGRDAPLPEPRPARVKECARHFERFWIEQRFIWPTEGDGTPDWAAIYFQILDHYLGFCLRGQ